MQSVDPDAGFLGKFALGGAVGIFAASVVPAGGVIGEAMVAIVLAEAMLEKFGGDHLDETKRNWATYLAGIGPRGRN